MTTSTYGQHVWLARSLAEAVDASRRVRFVAARDHSWTLLDFAQARFELRRDAARQLEHAKGELARSVNDHCRELGLPTDRDLDMERFLAGVRVMASSVRSTFERLATVAKPFAEFARSIEQNRPQIEYVLTPPTKETR